MDMDTLLIDLFESFEPACREKGVTLTLDLPETALPHIPGDPQRIRQLLLTLLDNAKTHTPGGRSIHIRSRASAQKQRLSVQVIDEGCGIPDQDNLTCLTASTRQTPPELTNTTSALA